MIVDFKGLLDEVQPETIFQIANQARPGTNYLFNEVLPEVLRYGYEAKSASMSIKPTMAKLVAIDSVYPRVGAAETTGFRNQLAKMAVEMPFPEQYLRELRGLVQEIYLREGDTKQELVQTMFNFVNLLLVQPHLDTMEWLRGQALVTGGIDWTSDDIRLQVDYGIPDEHFLPTRTGSQSYGGVASKFWDDIGTAQSLLGYTVRAIYMHSRTLRTVMSQQANSLRVVEQDELRGVFRFRRYVNINGQNMESSDVRDDVRIITYDDEGEVYDMTDPQSGKTKKIPFLPIGAILFIGAYNPNRFIVGSGAQPLPTPVNLGYTHLGPTEEGNGQLGRWANTFIPQGREWQFVGQSVTNGLPVIEAPDRIVVAATDV